jgi:hypothetical protein
MTQGCNNIVKHDYSDLLEQPCNKYDNINKVVTSCQQFVPNLLAELATWCEIFTPVLHVKITQLVNKVCLQQACSKLVNKF